MLRLGSLIMVSKFGGCLFVFRSAILLNIIFRAQSISIRQKMDTLLSNVFRKISGIQLDRSNRFLLYNISTTDFVNSK